MIESTVQISCVVEGHGEREAVPILIRRIAHQYGVHAAVHHPIRVSRSKLVKRDELQRVVTLAAMNLGGPGGIFVLIDADDDCPARLGPTMMEWAQKARPDVVLAVVLAKIEYEAWFLAAAESIAGRRKLAASLAAPAEPENVRDAKGWLSARMVGARKYSETLDQPALTGVFDINAARRAGSFDKCYREVSRLLGCAC